MRALLAVLALLCVAAPAAAQTATTGSIVDRAAAALRSDPVYVDPAAEAALGDADLDRLRAKIAQTGVGPTYVAILPSGARNLAGGSTDGLLEQVHEKVGERGTYVVVAGRQVRAGSDLLRVRDIADRAVEQHRDEGLEAILLAFLDDVRDARSGGGSRDGGGGGSGGLVLLGFLAFGAGAYAISRHRRRQVQAVELAEVKREVRDDLVELGDGIRALDLDVEMPGVSPEVRTDYETAVAAYERADTAWELARRPTDLAPVGAALEEGRWALASVQARLDGRPVPERRPPCFFDPRHGPSSREVVWAPPAGQPRDVPACEADAQRVERGEEPSSRQVNGTPYWNAGPIYAPYAGGLFGGFGGGLFGGLLLGDMLSPGIGWGSDGGGWSDSGGGGDFGGGGGDFGGGDFGGGDF